MRVPKLALAAALVLLPLSAQATGVEAIIAAIATYFAVTAATVILVMQWTAIIVMSVYGSISARRAAAEEAARARGIFNASLVDRSTTLLSPNPALRVVYGRSIAGGDVVAMFTSDKYGVHADGKTYTKPDGLKHIVVHVASHQVQAIHDVLIAGIRVGGTDADGWVLSTSNGTGKDYTMVSTMHIGDTSFVVAAGSGSVLVGDEVSFTGDTKRYPVVTGITGKVEDSRVIVIAAPGLISTVVSGTDMQLGNEYSRNRLDTRTVTIPAGGSLTVPNAVVHVLTTDDGNTIAFGDGVSLASTADGTGNAADAGGVAPSPPGGGADGTGDGGTGTA